MKSLNQISFIDSSGNEIKLNANNTKEAAVDKVPGTVPLRDASGRFRIGDTSVSSTDGYVAINKNYVDGRINVVDQGIAAEVIARQNAINALDKSDTAVNGQFVSKVSETDGIISVTRRSIVDDDGVVLKTGNQAITGIKTFQTGLRCTITPSLATDVVRKAELDEVNTRLDSLGFKQATITPLQGYDSHIQEAVCYQQGKIVALKIKPNKPTNVATNSEIATITGIDYAPSSNIEIGRVFHSQSTAHGYTTFVAEIYTWTTTNKIVVSKLESNYVMPACINLGSDIQNTIVRLIATINLNPNPDHRSTYAWGW